jgi:hypothetical protein
MSALVREIRDGFKGPVTHKFVLHMIATYADRTGLAWPSQERLAGDVGISERQVRRIVDELKASGWLTIEEPGDGRGNSTHYRVAKPVKADMGFPLSDTTKADMDDHLSDRSEVIKADMHVTERRTPMTAKADIAMSYEESEQSKNSQGEAAHPRRVRKRKQKQRTAETPLPGDFSLTPARRKFATDQRIANPDLLFELFRNKALEKKWTSGNWTLKWNQFVLHEVQFAAERAERNRTSRPAPGFTPDVDEVLAKVQKGLLS